MASVLASFEWPSLSYLWDSWRKFEQNGTNDVMERSFWATLSIVSKTLLLSSTQMGEDCWSHCWGLVGRAHLIELRDYRPGVSSFVGFLEVMCQLGCVRLHIYAEEQGQSVGNLIWWSLIVGYHKWHLITSSVIVYKSWRCRDSRPSRGEAHFLDVDNSESSYRPDREHYPCRIVCWCRHVLSLYSLVCIFRMLLFYMFIVINCHFIISKTS